MLELIHKKKSSPILLSLLEKPRHVRELRSEVGGSASTVLTRIQELTEEGLVQEELGGNWPYKKIIKLTDRGRDVAKVLKGLSGSAWKKKIALMSFKKRMKWPLLLLYKLKEVSGAVKMQKLLFLLKKEGGIETTYDFSPYKFGPYCEDIGKEIAGLVTAGLVDSKEGTYALALEGRKMAEEMYEDLKENERKEVGLLEKFNKMGRRSLLNYVYTNYPEESGKQ